MTKEEAVQKVFDISDAEEGYHEKASNDKLNDPDANSGSGNWTKYAKDLDAISNYYNGRKNGYDWCDIYVDWLFVKAFGYPTGRKMLYQPEKSLGAGTKYSAQYYQKNNAWYTTPEEGDQAFFKYTTEIGHTGIVRKITDNYIYITEGNTSNQVARKKYARTNRTLAGFGRPDWNLVTGESETAVDPPQIVVVLRKGRVSEDVKMLQNYLITLGYSLPVYGADGNFGNETLAAVKKFQKDNGLEVDGIVGPKTWGMIYKLMAEVSKTSNRPFAGYEPPDPEFPTFNYIVKKGDTLTKIALKYHTTADGLAIMNGIVKPYTIYVGQTIRVPK